MLAQKPTEVFQLQTQATNTQILQRLLSQQHKEKKKPIVRLEGTLEILTKLQSWMHHTAM